MTGLSQSKLQLSKSAKRYEREQGEIQCPARAMKRARETGAGSGGYQNAIHP